MKLVLSFGLLAILSLTLLFFYGPEFRSVTYTSADISNVIVVESENEQNLLDQDVVIEDNFFDDRETVQHVPLPPQVKAIYMSACVAGTPSFREDLVQLVRDTELNSIMIDIKDYSGTLAFRPQSEFWLPAWQASKCGARDMKEFIEYLHEENIFVIGRITVFQDPFLSNKRPDWAVLRTDGSVWADFKGLGFIDVAAREYWDKVVDLAVDSYNLGFDELNFDYVRYPSDGNMRDIRFPHTERSEFGTNRAVNLEAFFEYLHTAMTDPELFSKVRHENTGREQSIPWTSADTFGMTTTNFDDLSIGQIQERTAPYFDFVAPMVYPSHYPNGWAGFSNPNLYPYEIVYTAMLGGVERMMATTTQVEGFQHTRIGTSTPAVFSKPAFGPERLRTWIQDFNYGGTYGPKEVRAQIQGSYDAGVMDWMIWAPSNRYTKEALLPPDTYEVDISTQ